MESIARGRTGGGIGTGVGRGREGGRKGEEKAKASKTQIHETELDEVD